MWIRWPRSSAPIPSSARKPRPAARVSEEAAVAATEKKKCALAALTQAALALPGVAAAGEIQTDYLFSYYEEADLAGAKNSSGSDAARYEIESHLFRLVKPTDNDQVFGL